MGIKILVVDDEANIRGEAIECLTEADFECVEAANGKEGLAVLRSDPGIAVVLADIQMPGRSGMEINTPLL